ncbi:MAG: hypothetical protein R3C14_51890 [Caldilineaceae bacterium]
MRQPDFSGKYLVANGEGNDRDSVFRFDLDLGRQNPISSHDEDAFPQWSPDGLSLVFSSDSDGNDALSRIYWQEHADQQTDAPPIQFDRFALVGDHPVYLSNGRIAYKGVNSWDNWSREGIYSFEYRRNELNKPTMITDNSNDLPTDGTGDRILFMSNRNDADWEIYITSSTTPGDTARLTYWPGCDGLATASPSGNTIAFMGNHEGTWAVYVMQVGGSGQTKLFDIPNTGFGCGDGRWLNERMSWGP